MKILRLASASTAIFSVLGISFLLAGDNSCVSCHSKLAPDTFVGSEYLDWKNSIHREHDITCDLCHGGSPNASEKELAHKGVYKSGDPESTVYYKNVPGTCGGCHEEVYREFIQSNHYIKLEKSGSGPTCGTCHGSRATWIVTPQNIKKICSNCHNERQGIDPDAPDEARVLLMALNQSISLHRILTEFSRGRDDERIKEQLDKVESKVDRARIVWHSFDMEAVSQHLLEANETLNELEAEVLKK